MVRLRNALMRVSRRLADWASKPEPMQGHAAMQMAKVTSAIHVRQTSGISTKLRQVHKICDLSQPEALNTIAELERAGIVTIERNMGDAFESVIVLTDEAQRSLERLQQQEAA